MALSQNQSLSLGLSQPETQELEEPEPEYAVNNTVILLGVLTFVLQLCVAVFFLVKCWSYDKRMQETITNGKTEKIYIVQPNICLSEDRKKLLNRQQQQKTTTTKSTALQPPVKTEAMCSHDNGRYINSPPPPILHWDLVQSWPV